MFYSILTNIKPFMCMNESVTHLISNR